LSAVESEIMLSRAWSFVQAFHPSASRGSGLACAPTVTTPQAVKDIHIGWLRPADQDAAVCQRRRRRVVAERPSSVTSRLYTRTRPATPTTTCRGSTAATPALHPAVLDADGNPILDENGRFVPGPVAAIPVWRAS